MLATHSPVLCVVPAIECRSGEAGTVHCKITLDRLQWTRAFLHKRLEDRGQCWIFEIVKYAVVVRRVGNKTLRLAFAQIARGASSRDGRVDFHHSAERHVTTRKPGTTAALGRLR